jgi:hypothetical protein
MKRTVRPFEKKQLCNIVFTLLLALFLLPQKSFAQSKPGNPDSFKIVKTGGLTDLSVYEKAIKAADLENFRYKTKRNTIYFDSGVAVELFSAQELFIMGKSIQPNSYSDTRDKKYIQPVFHLAENGGLVAMFTKVLK